MAKKGNGKKVTAEKVTKFKEQAEAKAKAHQVKRLEFISRFGKILAAAWAKMEHPSSMGVWRAVFPKAEEPCRLVDYTLLALGIRQSKDEGLLAWVKADALIGSATSQPKATKKVTKAISKAKLRKDLGEAMSDGQVNV